PGREAPVPPAVLPVRRAVGRGGHAVLRVPGRVRRAGRRPVPDLQLGGLDRAGRLRHGQPARAGGLRRRPRPLQRLGVRGRRRADADVPARRGGRVRHRGGRRAVHTPVRDGWLMGAPRSGVGEYAELPAGVDGRELAEKLIAAGLEVETVERAGADVKGPLVVGEVLAVEELTGFKKPIRYCQVDVGDANGTGEPQNIVCGATNFAAGDRVVVVLPGGVLPGGFEIGARKTYGKVSEGMICSSSELGIGDDQGGILVLPPDSPVGADAIELLGLRDDVLHIAVTPDRSYALSIRGVAREAATAYGVPFKDPADVKLPGEAGGAYAASIADPTACDRFVLREVRGFDPDAKTPPWMQVRLYRAGMRPVSLAVDVTNYLMLELGQPLHAFDRAKLTGPIVVRRAEPGEKLETLDHVKRTLDPEDILITDESGPISMAGTMGGLATEIDDRATDMASEAAHFDAVGTARMSRRHRLHSEASYRFERGVDRELPLYASYRAVQMLAELGGAEILPGVTHAETPVEPVTVTIPADHPDKVAGVTYGRDTVVRRLEQVGCKVEGDQTL